MSDRLLKVALALHDLNFQEMMLLGNHINDAIPHLQKSGALDQVGYSALLAGIANGMIREAEKDRAALAAMVQAESGPAPSENCGWRPLSEYDVYTDDLVLVRCRVTEPETSELPKACELPVSSGLYGVGDIFTSIGHANEDGEWFVAGWDMTQDCWTDARGFEPIEWRPLELAPAQAQRPQ